MGGRRHLLARPSRTSHGIAAGPSSPLQTGNVPVKLNTAAILREGSLYQRQVEKELERWGAAPQPHSEEGVQGLLFWERRGFQQGEGGACCEVHGCFQERPCAQ